MTLYVLELIEVPRDIQGVVDDIADAPQPYNSKDSLYVLLSRGVCVHTITFIDHTEVIGPNSQQYFRKYWAKLGYDAATIDSPEIRQQERLLKEAIALVERIGLQFPGQWRTTYRTAQPSDITNALEQGQVVQAQTAAEGELLVIPSQPGLCWTYAPGTGRVAERRISDIANSAFAQAAFFGTRPIEV